MPNIKDISSIEVWDLPPNKLLVLIHPLGSILFSNDGKYWSEVPSFPEIHEIAESFEELLYITIEKVKERTMAKYREPISKDAEVLVYRVF